MSSPSNLLAALNRDGKHLSDLFLNKEDFCANWLTAKIARKQISVKRYSSIEERQLAILVRISKIKEKKSLRTCAICGTQCKRSRKLRGCCSVECLKHQSKLIGKLIAENHWCSSDTSVEICAKRIRTRKLNDILLSRHYVPWNKGKHGIYSLETIEKIRAAARNQFEKCHIKKTQIEEKVEQFLLEIGANFKYSFILCNRQYDFVIIDKKCVIEVHGDFWHGNPLKFGEGLKELRMHQIMKRQDDKIKAKIANDAGYSYYEFWEHDIHNNWDVVKEKILEIVDANYQCCQEHIKN